MDFNPFTIKPSNILTEDMIETAYAVAGLGIHGIKLHHLYVAKNTALAEDYFRGKVKTMGMDTYVKLAVDFLERIPHDVTVQRLVGDTHGNFLISPIWKSTKAEITQRIKREFERRGTHQGSRCNILTPDINNSIPSSIQGMQKLDGKESKFHTVGKYNAGVIQW